MPQDHYRSKLPQRYFRRDGSELTGAEHDVYHKARDSHFRVALDELGQGVWVSTIFDSAPLHYRAAAPLLFESQVDGRVTLEQRRYATETEAVAGHARLRRWWRRAMWWRRVGRVTVTAALTAAAAAMAIAWGSLAGAYAAGVGTIAWLYALASRYELPDRYDP